MTEIDDLTDLQGTVALNILDELKNTNKITPDKYEEYKKAFTLLHDTIVKILKNQKSLPARFKKMQTELKMKKDEFEQTQIQNEEAEQLVKKSQQEVKKAEQEEEQMKRTIDQLTQQYDKLESQKMDQEQRIADDEKEIRQKIQPEEEMFKQQIDRLVDEITKKKQLFEQNQKNLKDHRERIVQLDADNKGIQEEINKYQSEFYQIKDEPTRLSKKSEMAINGISKMKNDLEEKNEEFLKKEKKNEELKVLIIELKEKIADFDNSIKTSNKKIAEITNENKEYRNETRTQTEQLNDLGVENSRVATEIKSLKANIRDTEARKDLCNKEKEKEIKETKKADYNIKQMIEKIREYEISIEKYMREKQDILHEMEQQKVEEINIIDKEKITELNRRKMGNMIADRQSIKVSNEKQIEELNKQLQTLIKYEQSALKKIKMLTAMRESMARKASAANAEVRETKEDLKIKELTILDLTKKKQETEFKLNDYKQLYDEVKSARNKYVNMIQNTSQNLAELKELIKILQNELEILKNESQEKDSTLMQYRHILQLEVHKRDRAHAKLNKQEQIRKQKKEQVDQNINEIEKLNMIIMSLEKEMLILRKKYEQACESRNSRGIQLIDHNDELCILYEKSNIQENILHNGESAIKILEDEIRMIKIEMKETIRKIDVARKQVLLVPKLADRVIELKNELDLEKEREQQLSEELENPTNTQRWNELKGEDPDQEALQAKINVLEERLNNKKEQLLEKELILNEITNLSEKLRKQALDGRQSTLELSEKLNEFQSKLKDITRKMMASISELSMFQATAIKLQQERDELEKQNDDAGNRVSEGQPPTVECEIEYLKMVRDKQRYQEERNVRLQREALERNFPPFATKTTAEHRFNAYMQEEIGIPKPYGKNAPFQPSQPGVHMRFFKKPKQKEIEI